MIQQLISHSFKNQKVKQLLLDYTGAADVDGTNSERRAGKRVHVLQSTTEETNIKQTGAKARKEGEEQKPLDGFSIEGTEYANLFSSMEVIVERYAVMNENAGDVTPFQRPSEKDFRDVTAFIMCTLLHEKIHMPRLCQKMTLSDVLNPRISSTWAREYWGS